jgi:alpha-beta hydrolase superfamily lysophospholipase
LRPEVLRAVEQTRKLKGDIPIIVAGHSMGGAMASFCALDLVVSAFFLMSKVTTWSSLLETDTGSFQYVINLVI